MPVQLTRLSLIPPVGGVLLGTFLIFAVGFTPAAALDAMVADSGLAELAGVRPPVTIPARQIALRRSTETASQL